MEDMTISLNALLQVSAILVSLATGAGIIMKILAPGVKAIKQTKTNREDIVEIKDEVHEMHGFEHVICETLLVLVDHEITGNSIENLKKQKAALNKYLISRGE